jgi:hypothetical protein
VIARSRKVAKRLAMGVKHLMKKNGIEVVQSLEPDGERIWTYREAMVPEALPSPALGAPCRRRRESRVRLA